MENWLVGAAFAVGFVGSLLYLLFALVPVALVTGYFYFNPRPGRRFFEFDHAHATPTRFRSPLAKIAGRRHCTRVRAVPRKNWH